MIRLRPFPAAAPCGARLLAAASVAALVALVALPVATAAAPVAASRAAPASPVSPAQPRPRTGRYHIVSQGARVIHAKCLEGGNVVVPTRRGGTAAQRDRAIRAACKTVDYTK